MIVDSLPKRDRRRPTHIGPPDALRFVVVGGGIAGVCCAQELARLHPTPGVEVVIVTATEMLKEVSPHIAIYSSSC